MIETRGPWTGSPAAVLALYFLLPSTLFLVVWFNEYFSRMVRQPLVYIFGVTALLLPPVITWWQASHGGRRRFLWSVLVLAGSALALWLPGREVLLAGSLPIRAYTLMPEVFNHAVALMVIALVPALAGAIPAVLYALAVGQVRPTAGAASGLSVILIYVVGATIWAASFLISLVNPGPPPLFNARVVNQVVLQATVPENVEREAILTSYYIVLWRLRDGAPPGALTVQLDGPQFTVGLPAVTNLNNILSVLTTRGLVEFVDVGRTRIQPGTEVRTSLRPGAVTEEQYSTLATGNDLQNHRHWSGKMIAGVQLTASPSDRPVLLISLNNDGAEALQAFIDESPGNFLGIVIDGVVLHSVRIQQPIEQGQLTLRGLDPQSARLLTYLLRYGPLPTPLRVDSAGRP